MCIQFCIKYLTYDAESLMTVLSVIVSTQDTTQNIRLKNASPKIFICLIMVEYGSDHKQFKIYQLYAAENCQCCQQTQNLLQITYTFATNWKPSEACLEQFEGRKVEGENSACRFIQQINIRATTLFFDKTFISKLYANFWQIEKMLNSPGPV